MKMGRNALLARSITAALFAGLGAVSAHAAVPFFDWQGDVNKPVGAGYVPSLNLSDQTVGAVTNYLATHAGPIAVKIVGVTLSQSTIDQVYGTYNINYTFVDYEGSAGTVGPRLSSLQTAISNSAVTGPNLRANTSFIGNYAFTPIPAGSDTSASNPAATGFGSLNMLNESLYPGDAAFKSPKQVGGTSTAPNIRSALFTLPIVRFTTVAQNSGGLLHVPYVSPFNNYNNALLQNDGQGGFDTSKTAAAAGQLLSRNDFQALILHYRMRGADSFHLLDAGIKYYQVGNSQVQYTSALEESDASAGWSALNSSGVFNTTGGAAPHYTTATSGKIDGVANTKFEDVGVAYSEVYNDNGTLAVLISNLDSSSHSVNVASRVAGANLIGNFSVAAGHHSIITFTKSGASWVAGTQTDAFTDPNLASRDGVGIPEPTSVSLLAVGAIGVLIRRRRRN